jgi:hypothetical protein
VRGKPHAPPDWDAYLVSDLQTVDVHLPVEALNRRQILTAEQISDQSYLGSQLRHNR